MSKNRYVLIHEEYDDNNDLVSYRAGFVSDSFNKVASKMSQLINNKMEEIEPMTGEYRYNIVDGFHDYCILRNDLTGWAIRYIIQQAYEV